jgi:DNA repair exonuclease SbcCD ATPase subunit
MVFAVAVLLALGSIAFTLIVRGKDVPESPAISPTAHLEQRKAQIYENLRDLQFEYRLGKLSDSDYQKTKVDLQKELAKVLAEIDVIQPAQARAAAAPTAKAPVEQLARLSDTCPHCGTKFAQPMKFCGACGKAMA